MPLTPPPGLPPLLYQDEHILVLDKSSGLLSVPGIGPENQDCLSKRVDMHFSGALIIHRLDRDTSGVIIMARDPDSHRALSLQFETRQVSKSYIAVVAGEVREKQGGIDLPLRKDMDHPPRHMVDPVSGKPAVTQWKVLEHDHDQTRVELKPQTGRSHQLRVHLMSIGHAILGDDLYASPEIQNMSRRLMLHAQSLTVNHPVNEERMTFTADCPF